MGFNKFTRLRDTPNSYTDQKGKVPEVKETEDGLSFVDRIKTFLGMTDTPGAYVTGLPDDFESYDLGNLAGQGNWVGDTQHQVVSSPTKTGSRAIGVNIPADHLWRYIHNDFTGVADGEQNFYVRKAAIGLGGPELDLKEGDNIRLKFWFWEDELRLVDPFTGYLLKSGCVANTWYKITIQWRSYDHKIRARVDDGSWSSWINPNSSWGVINRIELICRPDIESYFDDFADSGKTLVVINSTKTGLEFGEVPRQIPKPYDVGDFLEEANNSQKSFSIGSTTTWYKRKEFKLWRPGRLRIKFDMRTVAVGVDARARIYASGYPVGTLRINPTTTYQTYTEDIEGWSKGHLVQLYVASTSHTGTVGYIRNFRLYCDEVTYGLPEVTLA